MSTASLIKHIFDPYFDAPIQAWESFVSHGEVISTRKDEVLKETQGKEFFLSFIIQGSGGVLLWKNNNFVCIDLCYEGEFFGDYMSFLTQSTSPLEVVTFEPSTLFRISHKEFTKIGYDTDFGDKICRFAAEALFIHKQKQQIELLIQTASERYAALLKQHPNIILRTPQKYIASYLGITPQSLSRIRNGDAL